LFYAEQVSHFVKNGQALAKDTPKHTAGGDVENFETKCVGCWEQCLAPG